MRHVLMLGNADVCLWSYFLTLRGLVIARARYNLPEGQIWPAGQGMEISDLMAWISVVYFSPCSSNVCVLQISDLLLGSRTSDMPEWFMDNCGNLCTTELSDSVLLFLCHGALAMLEWKNSSMGPSGEKLLLDIALTLLTLSKR